MNNLTYIVYLTYKEVEDLKVALRFAQKKYQEQQEIVLKYELSDDGRVWEQSIKDAKSLYKKISNLEPKLENEEEKEEQNNKKDKRYSDS